MWSPRTAAGRTGAVQLARDADAGAVGHGRMVRGRSEDASSRQTRGYAILPRARHRDTPIPWRARHARNWATVATERDRLVRPRRLTVIWPANPASESLKARPGTGQLFTMPPARMALG